MLCRGFLLGGTSGRTTLNGEGLQHQDGHSQIVATTVPNLLSYDPAFAYELAVIVRDGIRRMYELQENIFYYITIHNENYLMPAMESAPSDGIIRGMYRYAQEPSAAQSQRKAHLFGSGAIMTEVLRAQALLREWGVSADVWSVTSYNELCREGLRIERENLLGAGSTPSKPYVQTLLSGESGVFIAASDYMKALPLSISRWVPGPYVVLGTDGYGLSESRPDLRNWFEVSAEYIAYAALAALSKQGAVSAAEVAEARQRWQIDPAKSDPALNGPAGS
jgi:pyruvate dehydrogenase E1 component